jgi:hypothetical protein
MKVNRDLPRQTPRTPIECELAAKLEARELAEEQRLERSRRAVEVEGQSIEQPGEQL